jgi:uncharacterized protein (DUF433 family)
MMTTFTLSPNTDLSTEKILPPDPRFGIVSIDPKRLSGEPCFAGTRVPVRTLFVHLEAGDPLEVFLEDFEGVSREQAVAVLELSRKNLLPEADEK